MPFLLLHTTELSTIRYSSRLLCVELRKRSLSCSLSMYIIVWFISTPWMTIRNYQAHRLWIRFECGNLAQLILMQLHFKMQLFMWRYSKNSIKLVMFRTFNFPLIKSARTISHSTDPFRRRTIAPSVGRFFHATGSWKISQKFLHTSGTLFWWCRCIALTFPAVIYSLHSKDFVGVLNKFKII